MDSTILAEGRNWAFRVRSVSCLATGSSFEVAGGIVTNRHVASGSVEMQLSTWAGTDFNASVAGVSVTGPDLALLSDSGAPGATSPPTLASQNPPAGTPVWAVGYPEGDQLTVTSGHVVDYIDRTSLGISGQAMEITNDVKPGNSGSALVDRSGQVVGVVFATETLNGLGLAVPVTELETFLTSPGSQLISTCAE